MQKRFNFKKKTIEEILPPAGGRAEDIYWDTKTRGLYLRVKSTGIKSFYVRRKLKGKSERLFLGRFPELTIENVRAKAAEFHAAVADGKNLADARREDLAELTLGALFEQYMERHASKSRKTTRVMRGDFARYFGDWKNRRLSSITQEDVEKRHASFAESRGKYAANRAVELLRAMINKAIRWKLFKGDNPASFITPFPENKRTRILQPDEFSRFFAALDEQTDPNFQDFVMLCLLTGARKNNVLAMRWSDISLEAATWSISGAEMKNNEPQVVALTVAELNILRRRKSTSQSIFVFPGTGAAGHYVEPKRPWKRLLTRAGISDFHLHDLRRSLASWMANTGANVSLIKSALNHKDIKTTLTVYAHTVKDAERQAREKAHQFMLSHSGGREGNVVPLHHPVERDVDST